MSLHPLAASQPPMNCWSMCRGSSRPTISRSPTCLTGPEGRLRHIRAPRLVLERQFHGGPHPGHLAGHLRVPPGAGITGPLYIGMDTHALSEPALASAIEVFAGNEQDIMVQAGFGYTPTPAISHAILTYNHGRSSGLADGVVITPRTIRRRMVVSNTTRPAADPRYRNHPGGAGTRQRDHAGRDARDQAHVPGPRNEAETTHLHDYIIPYVSDLRHVVDLPAIAASGLKIGVDPMGGASVGYWQPIAEMYGLNLEVVNPRLTHLFLHDRRQRRQDPYGLLVTLCHGGPDRPQRPV